MLSANSNIGSLWNPFDAYPLWSSEVCTARPTVCCYSRDTCHWGEPRTCSSCRKANSVFYSCGMNYGQDSCDIRRVLKHLCREGICVSSLEYMLKCAGSAKVCRLWVNQSKLLKQLSYDIAPLVRRHSSVKHARSVRPPRPRTLTVAVEISMVARCGSSIVWSVKGAQKLSCELVGWAAGKNSLTFMLLL